MVTDDAHTRIDRRRSARIATVAIVEHFAAPARRQRHAWIAAGIIGIACLLHLAYLVFACPYDLAPDEAHYWHWSRHLDTAYYSKGPLIAWLIRGSCELLGGVSVALTGSEVLAVRLPAVACHAALLAAVFVLSSETLRSSRGTGFQPAIANGDAVSRLRRRLGRQTNDRLEAFSTGNRLPLAVLTLALTVPPLTAGAILMTIDAPFLACWAWALVFIRRATAHDHLRDWVVAGVCCGLGSLAKFPMLLVPAALVLYLLTNRERRRLLFHRGIWVMFALIGMASLPILEWNVRHGWVEARHVMRQIRGDGTSLLSLFAFLGGQFGFLVGYWFIAFAAAAWCFRPSRTNAGTEFLWYFSVPVWLLFLIVSTRTAGQVNWPAAAYVAGFPLAVAWVHRQVTDPDRRHRRFAQAWLAFAVAFGLLLTHAAHFPAALMRPVLSQVVAAPTAKNPTPLRRLDPTCRLQGWRTLAAEVDVIRDRVRAEGQEAVLVGMVWTVPGELSFYCREHPPAYSFGLALADRHSQYDVWRPNPVADAQAFHGRTFIYVGDEIPGMADLFDRIEPPVRVEYAEDGHPLAAWTIWVAHGFRGFRDVAHGADY